jgi:Protein of unknown function (DUF2934)
MQDETGEQIRDRLLGDEGVRESISLRAYEIYEQRGCGPGCDLEDWLQAESEILPPLIEEESQRGAGPQAAFDETPDKKPVTVEEKPMKKTARLLKSKRPADEKGSRSY